MTDAQKHIDAIRDALAMGPIPGVWYQGSATGAFKNCVYDKRVWWNADGSRGGDTPNLCVVLPESQETTAAYIAACHPDAMHAILAHIDQQAEEIERLRSAGACLANCAYNIAQFERALTNRERETLRLCVIDWDTARKVADHA